MKNIPKYKALLAAFAILVVASACSRQKVSIGKDAPQVEIQKCMELSEKKKFEEAIECLEIFKSRFAQTEYGRTAELAIADNYFNNKEYLLAADTYNVFTKLHPTSPKLDYAYYRLGLSYLEETPKSIDRDQQYIGEAIYYLRTAVVSFPKSEYHEAAVEALKDARSRVARRIYYIGNFYYKTGEYMAAVPRFIDLVNKYPESNLVPKTLYKLVVAAGELKKVNESKMFFSKLSLDYPDSEWTKKAEPKLAKYIKEYGDVGTDAPPTPMAEPSDLQIPEGP